MSLWVCLFGMVESNLTLTEEWSMNDSDGMTALKSESSGVLNRSRLQPDLWVGKLTCWPT